MSTQTIRRRNPADNLFCHDDQRELEPQVLAGEAIQRFDAALVITELAIRAQRVVTESDSILSVVHLCRLLSD